MISKEKVKQQIDRLSDQEVEKVYLYLSIIKKKSKPNIRSLKLHGKLDNQDLRTLVYV